MGTKKIVITKNNSEVRLAKMRTENRRLRERLDYHKFVLIDMLQALESIERSCKELLEDKE